jgi:ABC-type enterochelin transport system substrate-binding protein
MKTTTLAIMLSTVVLAGACKNDQTTSATATSSTTATTQAAASTDMSPEALGELGAAIKKQPKDAQRLLSDHGLTEQSFEKAVRKVAEDPAASRRYTDAYKKAGA